MWCKYNDIANESSFQSYPERPSKHHRHFQLSSFRNCLTQLGAKHPSRFMDVYQDWDAFGTFIFCFLTFSVNNMPEAPQNISVIVTEVSSWDCFFSDQKDWFLFCSISLVKQRRNRLLLPFLRCRKSGAPGEILTTGAESTELEPGTMLG